MEKLDFSTWEKTDPIESRFPTFFQAFPDLGLMLNYSPTNEVKGHYLVWGGGYRELGEGRVLTILEGASEWYEESYRVEGEILVWVTQTGTELKYRRCSESAIPEDLLKRREEKLSVLSKLDFPEPEERFFT